MILVRHVISTKQNLIYQVHALSEAIIIKAKLFFLVGTVDRREMWKIIIIKNEEKNFVTYLLVFIARTKTSLQSDTKITLHRNQTYACLLNFDYFITL